MIGGLIVIAVVGIVIWSQVGVSQAEPEPLAAVKADDRIVITDDSAGIVLAPAEGAGDVGLVFIPGGKVDPWAYAAKLSDLVAEDGITVVITKPWLNLAFFDLRPLDAFTEPRPRHRHVDDRRPLPRRRALVHARHAMPTRWCCSGRTARPTCPRPGCRC